MKVFKHILTIFLVSFLTLAAYQASAQCAMCTLTAENSTQNGNMDGNGLNSGILYLLAAPYIAIAAIGFLWYKKYRRKNVPINMKTEKINLN